MNYVVKNSQHKALWHSFVSSYFTDQMILTTVVGGPFAVLHVVNCRAFWWSIIIFHFFKVKCYSNECEGAKNCIDKAKGFTVNVNRVKCCDGKWRSKMETGCGANKNEQWSKNWIHSKNCFDRVPYFLSVQPSSAPFSLYRHETILIIFFGVMASFDL